jgi:UDP-N-acetylmuramate dehydrogenase
MSIPASVITRLAAVPGLRYWRQAPLAPFTSIGVGGRAALLVTLDGREAAAEALDVLIQADISWTTVGSGTNLLVGDQGYAGVALKLDASMSYAEGPYEGNGAKVGLVVGGALPLPRLATLAAEHGLSGLEWACGIPGTVGGGVAMNAGAHGGSLSDVVEALETAGPDGVACHRADEITWGYRSCRLPVRSVVTAVQLALVPGDRALILQQHRSLLRTRRQTQPRGVRTFGSTFKNPPGESAGRLLERAGMKGVRRGGAQVSPVHANFIANVGEATAADVLALMGMMRDAVVRRTGIVLEPEVTLLGARFPWEEADHGPPG